MKNKHSLKTKLQVIFYWLFKHGEGIVVNCGMCKSTQLNLISSTQMGDVYTSTYKCRRCGATAINKESWIKS